MSSNTFKTLPHILTQRDFKTVRVTLQWIVTIFSLSFILNGAAQTAMDLPTLQVKKSSANKGKTISNAIVFSQGQIRRTGSTSVTQFLRKEGILSIQGSSGVNNQHNISIHGFGTNASQNALVQIDGIPDTSTSSVSGELNNIMPQNIGNISVLPGSYGARYGDQAVGGVVSITTHHPGKPIHQIQIGMGNNDQRLATLFYSQRFSNHIGVNLGFSGLQNHHNQPNALQKHYIVNGKMDYVGSNGNISLNFLDYQDNSRIPGYYALSTGQLRTDSLNFVDRKGSLSYLTGNYYFSPKWHWHGAVANNYDTDSGYFDEPIKDNQMHWLIQNSLHYKKMITVGDTLNFARYGAQTGTQVNENASEIDNAVYANSMLAISSQWDINLGARYSSQALTASDITRDNHTKNNDVFVSSTGLTWHIHPNLFWYIRRAGNFVFAKGNEQLWAQSTLKQPLPLQNQTGVSYETGLDWQPQSDEFKVSLYQLDLNHELSIYIPLGQGSAFPTMSNIPPTRRLGVDAMARITLSPHWLTILQVTVVSAKFRSGVYIHNQIPSVSPYHGSIALNYHQHGWQAWVNETYHSHFFAANDFSNSGPQLSGYFLTNFHIAKTWHAMTLGLSVNNVFNHRFAGYTYAYGSNPTNINYYLGDGISAMGNITLQF